jgi:glycosyltransferase involved in cell wall biosynthesis
MPPLVSCLMVTLPTAARFDFIRRSIAAYCAQTLENRELLIVLNRGDPATRDALRTFVGSLSRKDIRLHAAPDELTLGGLRNLSIDEAAGEIICQWDDDDLYHPSRLSRQYEALSDGSFRAVYLQELMHFFPDRRSLYMTNWRATPTRSHPGTLMARRSAGIVYPSQGADAARGEDSSVALRLIAEGGVGYLGDQPHLYVYVTHDANTWHRAHHEMLSAELSVSRGRLARYEPALRAGLAPFAFPSDSIDVCGSNGVAFRL